MLCVFVCFFIFEILLERNMLLFCKATVICGHYYCQSSLITKRLGKLNFVKQTNCQTTILTFPYFGGTTDTFFLCMEYIQQCCHILKFVITPVVAILDLKLDLPISITTFSPFIKMHRNYFSVLKVSSLTKMAIYHYVFLP